MRKIGKQKEVTDEATAALEKEESGGGVQAHFKRLTIFLTIMCLCVCVRARIRACVNRVCN